MSGPPYGRPPRGLSLTEELDRLDQSITLTMQQIDENFNKSLRIVTEKILPVVEQYGKHSSEVWEGSKFWKQFFEASANVSLSGYEESPTALDNTEQSTTQNDETSTDLQCSIDYDEGNEATARLETNRAEGNERARDGVFDQESEIDLSSPTQMTGTVGTPKLPASAVRGSSSRQRNVTTGGNASASRSYRSPSPRKYTGSNPIGSGRRQATPGQGEPSTPTAAGHGSVGLVSSPFEPESNFKPSTAKRQPATRGKENKDPVMHWQVLDKNYRIQATPMTQRRKKYDENKTQATPVGATKTKALWEDSPESSPEIERPQLRSDLFSPARERASQTPGVSVLTPMQDGEKHLHSGLSTGRRLFTPGKAAGPSAATRSNYTNRSSIAFEETLSDDGIDYELSPPKTMQFHIPHSRLVQTPAREASKRIVEDLLMTAGADGTTDIEASDENVQQPSPSVVKRGWEMEDDTF